MDYTTINGTSFSAPHVAATVALMLSVNSDLSPSDIRSTLQASADNVPDMGGQDFTEQYGYGRLNAHQAVRNLYVPDVFSSLDQAFSVATEEQVVLLTDNYNISSDKTIPDDVTVEVESDVIVSVDNNQQLSVDNGGELIIQEDVVFNMDEGTSVSIDGYAEMNGTSANPVTFSATGGGDWDGIDLYGSGSSLNHVEVEDAENGITAFNLSGLELSNVEVTNSSQDGIRLINSTLSGLSGYINAEDNSRYGLYVDGQSNSGLNNNTLKNNSSGQLVIDGGGSFTNISNTLATNTGAGTNGLMAMDNSHIQISSSSIYDNPVNDAYAIQNSTIDAQSNWWGQAPPYGDQFYEDATSDIDYSNHLFWDPLPSGQSQQLAAATHVEPT